MRRYGLNIKKKVSAHLFEKFLSAYPRPGVYAELHLGDLLVDLLHEVDDEVDQLVAVHLVSVEVRDQEADVVTLKNKLHAQALRASQD